MLNNDCPCGSGRTFTDCCKVYHLGQHLAPTAEALMRSRYSAYATGAIDYIIKTTHPDQQAALTQQRTRLAADQTRWLRLEIIATDKGLKHDTRGRVEFKAWYHDDITGQAHAFHETSFFIKQNDRWFYIHPKLSKNNTSPHKATNRNSPCPCGSGKKYKKCCLNKLK